MRQFSGRECKSGTVSSWLFRVQKKNMPRKKLHCSYSLVVNSVENVFRCGKRRAAYACPGLTGMGVCLEQGLCDTMWRKQNEPSTWAGKLLKKVPFLSFCTWVEAGTQFVVKLSSLVWEMQWNGNPQSDFRCRFISFLRAWGNFISTFAMGVSWIFLIPGLAPTAVEVAGSLAFIHACCHFDPYHPSDASSLARCPQKYWALLAVFCVPVPHSPVLSSC